MNGRIAKFNEFLKTGKVFIESEEVLLKFEKLFPKEIVRANPKERPFEITEENMHKIFDVLNGIIFNGKLNPVRIFVGNNQNIVNFQFKTFNKNITVEDSDKHLAFYEVIPIEDNKLHRFILSSNETIVVNSSYGRSSFGYAVSVLSHEMIHQYDFHFGDALKYSYLGRQYGIDFNLHETKIFKTFMKKIPKEFDIPILIDGNGRPYIELNEENQRRFLKMKEMLSEKDDVNSTKNHTVISRNNDGQFVIMDTIPK